MAGSMPSSTARADSRCQHTRAPIRNAESSASVLRPLRASPPAELVGAVDRGGARGERVRTAPVAGEGEEAAERDLHRAADGLAHRAAEGVLVGRHVADDLVDHVVGDGGELGADRGDRRRRQQHPRVGPGLRQHPTRHHDPLFVSVEQNRGVDSPALVMSLAFLAGTLEV